MWSFLRIAYIVFGIFQFFAIVDGVKFAFRLSSFFAWILAFILTYIPLVGSGFGVYGAYNVWNWNLLPSFALFYWYVPVWLVFMAIALIGAKMEERRERSNN